jgi:hypothetical protein
MRFGDERQESVFLCQLARDVETAQQLALDIQLRKCWPVGVNLQAFANCRIGKNVKRLKLNALTAQELHHLVAEATAWLLGSALENKAIEKLSFSFLFLFETFIKSMTGLLFTSASMLSPGFSD